MAGETELNNTEKKKVHRERKSGRKAEKKKAKSEHKQILTDKQRNPKAFAINSAVQAERRFRRKKDIETKKQHIPVIDRTTLEPPPVIVAVVGPPKVGKSTLINNLVKNFTKQPMANIRGPVTIVIGKRRRVTLIECNNDINAMIDLAKIADLVLLLVDAAFGFEMEVFEFLNICQVHGMPRIMGVLTHLDLLKHNKQLKNTKKTLKHRFWTEVYQGAKLFYLSGLIHGEYLKNEIKNLGRFISVIKFRPLVWRNTHPYILADRLEDVTTPDVIRQNKKADRDVCLYGYVRGIPLNKENSVHIPGYGDMVLEEVNFLPDPCPTPERKKRSLIEKERIIYAPFSGVGGVVYDKDAVYVELAGSHSFTEPKGEERDLVHSMIDTETTIDTKIDKSVLKIFTDAKKIVSSEFENKIMDSPENSGSDSESGSENDEENSDVGENKVLENGRVRRKVSFESSVEKLDDSSDTSEEEDDDDDDDNCDENDIIAENEDANRKLQLRGLKDDKDIAITSKIANVLSKLNDKQKRNRQEVDLSENVEEPDEIIHKKQKIEVEDEENNFESSAVKWKDNLAQKAADSFIERQNSSQNLWKLVYGQYQRTDKDDKINPEDDYAEKIGGIFKLIHDKERGKVEHKEDLNLEDNSIFKLHSVRDWTDESNKNFIKDCFVTGTWKKSEDAEELLKLDDLSDGEDGDFEDLETGEKHEANKSKEDLLEKKKKLKEKFDAEYDDKEEHTFYDDLKSQVNQQSEINRAEFEGLSDEQRVELEGYRAGMYVRVKFSKVPYELLQNFDPTYPLIIGGLLPGEENIGYVQVRMKKHRWFTRTLKNKDPLIISLGWRRFQTIPVFAKLEDNMKMRMLKYTPAHVSCMAQFYGPLTPQSTGFLAVQNISVRSESFRITATGSVVELDQSAQIMKKLKLIGTPYQIYKKTAFIKGMFSSVLEVGKFEGAKIKTVSGIRGQIKKPLSKPEGAFRATFEDKIKMSDIVFCRTWYQVTVPKFYNPVTSLLLPPDQKSFWTGMRTLRELKLEHQIKNQSQPDSLYTEIIREPRIFKPLVIPKALQKSLPYKDKPKIIKESKSLESQRIAVIREPYEQKVAELMKMVRTNFEHKKEQDRIEMVKRVEQHRKVLEFSDAKKMKRQKELKKQVFRAMGKMNIKSHKK